MQLSTKARYAVRAMVELAIHYGQGQLQLKEISKNQGISEKYLDQLLSPLRAKGYVYTLKGSQGGYCLARPPEEITIYQIISIVEGSLAPAPCIDNPKTCPRVDICATRDVWMGLKDRLIEELESINLAMLAQRQVEKNRQAGSQPVSDYHI